MQLHKIKFGLVIAIAIILIGCEGFGNGGTIKIEEYRSGSKGVSMKFMKNTPPKEMFEGTDFILSFEIKNEGAYDIEDGILTLSIEEDYMQIREWGKLNSRSLKSAKDRTAMYELKGKSREYPVGDSDVIAVKMKTTDLERQTEIHTANIIISTCYTYNTIFADTVCIDTDFYNQHSTIKNCEVKDLTYSGQGAPVAISKVEPTMVPGEGTNTIPVFKIHFKNTGGGQIFSEEHVSNACSSDALDSKEFNKLSVSARLSDKRLSCTPNPIILRRDHEYVTCTLDEEIPLSGGTYLSPLTVEVSYGYTDSITTQVEIRRKSII
jgi:hypothetical protein